MYWRIGITQPREATLRWKLPRQEIEKCIAVASNRQQFLAVDARRPGPGWTDRLLHPGEAAFEASDTIRGIDVQYPRRSTPLLGLDVPWWATFLVISVLAAVLGGRVMRIQF